MHFISNLYDKQHNIPYNPILKLLSLFVSCCLCLVPPYSRTKLLHAIQKLNFLKHIENISPEFYVISKTIHIYRMTHSLNDFGPQNKDSICTFVTQLTKIMSHINRSYAHELAWNRSIHTLKYLNVWNKIMTVVSQKCVLNPFFGVKFVKTLGYCV